MRRWNSFKAASPVGNSSLLQGAMLAWDYRANWWGTEIGENTSPTWLGLICYDPLLLVCLLLCLKQGICSLASHLFPTFQSIPKVPSFQGCLPGLEDFGLTLTELGPTPPQPHPISLPDSIFQTLSSPLISNTSCSLVSVKLISDFYGIFLFNISASSLLIFLFDFWVHLSSIYYTIMTIF